jgi:hypothetical protein
MAISYLLIYQFSVIIKPGSLKTPGLILSPEKQIFIFASTHLITLIY